MLTTNYFLTFRNIAPINSQSKEIIIELCKNDTGQAMIKISIDGQIEFTYSNQKFEASELIEIANLAKSAHLLIKNQ